MLISLATEALVNAESGTKSTLSGIMNRPQQCPQLAHEITSDVERQIEQRRETGCGMI